MNAYYTRFALAWLVSVGAACTSAPIRYYTLIPPPDMPLRAAGATLAIDVQVVHIPPQLNRSGLMVRSGPTETALLENERWASPIKDEIKEAVRVELLRRLGGMSGLPPSVAKLAIDIDVQRLEAQLGRYALLQTSWSANLSSAGQPPGGARVTSCTFRADEEIHGGYAGMVEGYQREIAALADGIAAAVTRSASDIDAPCQASIGSAAGGSGTKDH
ncbi:MAG: PqiC family protein [Steroidobacteraceae bacterium]